MLLCGMHPENVYASANEKERWYFKTPVQHIEDLVRMYAAMLEILWDSRAEQTVIPKPGREGPCVS